MCESQCLTDRISLPGLRFLVFHLMSSFACDISSFACILDVRFNRLIGPQRGELIKDVFCLCIFLQIKRTLIWSTVLLGIDNVLLTNAAVLMGCVLAKTMES